MRLHEELYFEIELNGVKEELVKFVNFVLSGELDEFFEISEGHIIYDDEFAETESSRQSSLSIVNDDYGIELDSFDPEEFLDVFCKAAKNLEVSGHFYDINDDEYRFESPMGDPCYIDADSIEYSDDLDEEAYREELRAKDEY